MDFVLRHSEQARLRFTYAKSDEPVIVEKIVYVERGRSVPAKTKPGKLDRQHRQKIIGIRAV